jgi:hypothetical protein
VSKEHHRFSAGINGTMNQIEWRIAQGKKCPGDLRLDIRSPVWRAVPMSLGFLCADFFYQNEEVLMHHKPHFYLGGDKYLHGLQEAYVFGWEPAVRRLSKEKEHAA